MKKHNNGGFTLMETLAAIGIIVLLVIGIGTGIRAASRAYTQSTFESNCGTLSDILNTTIADALRYSENITVEGDTFTFTNYDYNVKNSTFSVSPAGDNSTAGYVVLISPSDSSVAPLPIVNEGAYAGDLAVKDLRITASKIDDGDNYYFDISYTICSLTNSELFRSYTARIRQANADVEIVFSAPSSDDEDEENPETIDRDNISIVYDCGTPPYGASDAHLLNIYGTPTQSITQVVNPRESTTFHTYGASSAVADWYTLKGWSTSRTEGEEGSSFFECDADVSLSRTMIDNILSQGGGTLPLYPVWEAKVYTINYTANGGNGSYSQTFKITDNTVTLYSNSDSKITNPGYSVTFDGNTGLVSANSKSTYSTTAMCSFDGWECGGTQYGKTDTLTISKNFLPGFDPSVASVTMNARWGDAKITTPTASKDGWTFVGWGSDTSATTGIDGSKEIIVAKKADYYAIYSVSITFNANNGTPTPAPQLHYYGHSDITWPTEPTRTGYNFKGWYTTAKDTDTVTGTNISKVSGFVTQADKYSVTCFYARWTSHKYTIRFIGNGATGGTMADLTKRSYGSTYTLTANAFTRAYTISFDTNGGDAVSSITEQWTFNRWLCSNGKYYADKAEVKRLSPDNGAIVTMTAQWTEGKVTLPTPTRANWTFVNWKDSTGKTYSAGLQAKSFGKNTELTAQWKCTVTYDLNGATSPASISPQEHTSGASSFALTSTVPTRTGYTFLGWTTVKDNGNVLTNATAATYLNSHGNTTLYAKWGGNSYTIVYDANASSSQITGSTDDTSCVYGQNVTLRKNGFTRTFSFTFYSTANSGSAVTKSVIRTEKFYPAFRGWNNPAIAIDSSTTPAYVGDNGQVTLTAPNFVSTSGGTYTLYATWSRPKVELKNYIYNPNSWHFCHWSRSATSNTLWKSSTDSILITNSTDIYAVCSRTITYKDKTSGEVLGTSTYYSNQSAPALMTLEAREGYKTPDGWYTEGGTKVSNLSSAAYTADGNLTLYATWSPQYKYSITFAKGDGGDTVHPATVPSNYSSTAWSDSSSYTYNFTKPSRTGYTFSNWTVSSKNPSTITVNASDTSVTVSGAGAQTATVALTANWTPVEYTITYKPNGGTPNSDKTSKYKYTDTAALAKNQFTNSYTVTLNANSGTVNGKSSDTVSASRSLSSWKTGASSGTTYSTLAELSRDSKGNVSLYAQWDSGKLTSLPTPSKSSSWTFDGWYNGSTKVTASSSSPATFTAATTLKASWKCTVTFEACGGTFKQGDNSKPTYVYNSKSITVPSVSYTGREFDGWYLDTSYTGTKYTDSSAIADYVNGHGNTTFYAKWNPRYGYKIAAINHSGVTGPVSDISNLRSTTSTEWTTSGTKTYDLGVPSREGYTFAGWSASATNGTASVSGNTLTVTGTSTKETSVTLTANWNINYYKITLKNNYITGIRFTIYYKPYGASSYSNTGELTVKLGKTVQLDVSIPYGSTVYYEPKNRVYKFNQFGDYGESGAITMKSDLYVTATTLIG